LGEQLDGRFVICQVYIRNLNVNNYWLFLCSSFVETGKEYGQCCWIEKKCWSNMSSYIQGGMCFFLQK